MTLGAKAGRFGRQTKEPKGRTYRVYAGAAQLGAAWKKASRQENACLSVTLDEDSFGKALNVALVIIDEVHWPV